MALEKMRGDFCRPDNAARFWKFNAKGEISWSRSGFKGMRFIARVRRLEMQKIKKNANNQNSAVIIQVNHNHWLYVEKVGGKHARDVSVVDPLGGIYYDQLPSHYEITGYAVFERDEHIPEWMKLVLEKAKAKGLKRDDILNKINIETMEEVLFEMGVIDKVEGVMTLGRFLVVMEKIKGRW